MCTYTQHKCNTKHIIRNDGRKHSFWHTLQIFLNTLCNQSKYHYKDLQVYFFKY
jgi:hypothetical protein